MPSGKHKSRSMRRVYVKKPGNTVSISYRKRNPSKAKCIKCGAVLKGVASERPCKMQSMAKTKKRPSRPYGGALCSKCMREEIKGKNV